MTVFILIMSVSKARLPQHTPSPSGTNNWSHVATKCNYPPSPSAVNTKIIHWTPLSHKPNQTKLQTPHPCAPCSSSSFLDLPLYLQFPSHFISHSILFIFSLQNSKNNKILNNYNNSYWSYYRKVIKGERFSSEGFCWRVYVFFILV
jgi:hypothetical protein